MVEKNKYVEPIRKLKKVLELESIGICNLLRCKISKIKFRKYSKLLSSCCITTCILHQTSAMSGTVVIWYAETRSAKQFKLRMRWGRKSRISHEGCVCDSERRRASAALMPPLPPAALLYSSYCLCPVSSREKASHSRNYHLSLFTCVVLSPQHRSFLAHV